MIRLVYCVARRQDIPVEEFRLYWDNDHPKKMQRIAQAMKADRLTQSATLLLERHALMMEHRGTASPFDGMVEMWWENSRDLEALIETPTVQAAVDELFASEEGFIDHASSRAFFTAEPTTYEL